MKIFVSYRSTDRAAVDELVADLESMGNTVWLDRQRLMGGQKWWNEIIANLQGCDLLVVALTPDYLESYACQLEYAYCADLQRHVMPVLLKDGVDFGRLPSVLQQLQVVDYRARDKREYQQLANAIAALPTPPPLPNPLPDPPAAPISPLADLSMVLNKPELSYDEQMLVLNRIKNHMHEPENADEAQSMLNRLRDHRSLLASVLREIETVAAGRKATANTPQNASEAQATGQFKGVLKALDGQFDFVEPGEYVYLEKNAMRLGLMLNVSGKFYVTNRRLVFRSQGVGSALSGLAGRNADLNIPLKDIDQSNIVYGVATGNFMPSIEFVLRGGEKHRFALRESALVYANRQEIVALIERLKKEG